MLPKYFGYSIWWVFDIMVVCLCNYLNEKKIKHAIDKGARSPQEIYHHCGVEMDCGQCFCTIQIQSADDPIIVGRVKNIERTVNVISVLIKKNNHRHSFLTVSLWWVSSRLASLYLSRSARNCCGEYGTRYFLVPGTSTSTRRKESLIDAQTYDVSTGARPKGGNPGSQ